MRSRPRSLLVVAASLVLALGLLWSVWQGAFGSLRGIQNPTAAIFIPRRAPLAVSLLVNPGRLAKLPQVDLNNFQEGLLDSAQLDYGRDIKPWLGDEVTLAVTSLDLDRDASNGQQPGYLLALAAKNSARAREFLQVYWQRRAADGTTLHYEQVSGVKLIYGESALGASPASRTVASALVGDRYILFANQPKVIRDAVNNVQVPELNLASSSDYQRSLKALDKTRFAYGYANLAALGGWLENQGLAIHRRETASLAGGTTAGEMTAGEMTAGETTTGTEAAAQYRALALSLGANRQGLLADLALLLDPAQSEASGLTPEAEGATGLSTSSSPSPSAREAEPLPPEIQPERILRYLPGDAIAALSSVHLDQLWQQAQPLLAAYPALGTLVDRSLDQLQAQWQLDVSQDIFPWVTGDYALGQLQRPDGLDWIFVVDRTSSQAQAGIQHLDDLAKQQGYSIGALTLADREVTAWTRLKPEGEQGSAANAIRALVRGVHAQVEDYELFSTSLDAMEAVLESLKGDSLSQSKTFQRAVAPLPRTNRGYLYVNWRDNRALLEQKLPLLRVLEATAQPLFRGLKTASLTGQGKPGEEGVQRAAIALQLGR